jgi:hypothetical protein
MISGPIPSPLATVTVVAADEELGLEATGSAAELATGGIIHSGWRVGRNPRNLVRTALAKLLRPSLERYDP